MIARGSVANVNITNTDIITVKEELNLEFEELEFEELECQDYRSEEFGTKVIELLRLQNVPADTDASEVSTYQNDQGSSQIVIKEETEFGTKVIELLGLQNVPVYTDASEVSTCQDDQESSQIVIKEEIDCDSDDGSVSGLDSLHFADKVAGTTLRRSSRRRCLRFSVVDLQESSSDETPVSKYKKKVRKRRLAPYTPTHSASKPQSCGQCGKIFSRSDNLKEHERLHSGQKYPCAQCGREFSQRGQLSKHVRSHTHARSHACSHTRAEEQLLHCADCGKAIRGRQSLRDHVRIHTGERPFACRVCGKAFRQAAHLRDHARIHTGERRHGCDACGRLFLRRSHLKVHVCGRTKWCGRRKKLQA